MVFHDLVNDTQAKTGSAGESRLKRLEEARLLVACHAHALVADDARLFTQRLRCADQAWGIERTVTRLAIGGGERAPGSRGGRRANGMLALLPAAWSGRK